MPEPARTRRRSPNRTGPAPLAVLAAGLVCTGGGQWHNRHPLKAAAAPTVVWLAVDQLGHMAPAAVGLVVAGLAAEATLVAWRRQGRSDAFPATRPLIAALAATLTAVPPALLGGQWTPIVGAGQLYNGYLLRALCFSATWWAALLTSAHSLGYAIYLVPAAATIEAVAVSYSRLDRYRPAPP